MKDYKQYHGQANLRLDGFQSLSLRLATGKQRSIANFHLRLLNVCWEVLSKTKSVKFGSWLAEMVYFYGRAGWEEDDLLLFDNLSKRPPTVATQITF